MHLNVLHMVKINYIHKVLSREWNTCLPNLIISHQKRERNILQNHASTHLNIAQDYLSVVKTEE